MECSIEKLVFNMFVDILGTRYEIIEGDAETYPKLNECDGYCDNTVYKCVINIEYEQDLMNKENLQVFINKIKRHEIIHAFLFESGLAEATEDDWARNEEMVDWFANQFPKIFKAFQQANCM